MNCSHERGSPDPEGTLLEDRITAALTIVSSHIDVAPRPFKPPATSRGRGRNTDPVRTPLRWAAVAALIVGVAGMVAISRTPIGDDVVVAGMSGEDAGSPVDYEAPLDGTLDPDFLDYVAPINGDEGRAAHRLFVDGYAWARAKTITACLQDGGLSDAESSWAVAMTDWYAFHASSAQVRLPALRTVAEDGLDRPRQEVVSQTVSSTVDRCRETDSSKASTWQRRIEPLQEEFAASVDQVIADVEAGPIWDGVHACMTGSGAPANDDGGVPQAHIEGYIDWLAGEQSRGPSVGSIPPDATRSADGDGGSPESKAFARCAEPFYSAVEMSLARPRESFVAEHRQELLKLQAEFADFA